MRFSEFRALLVEDYKSSAQRFLEQGADPEEVKSALDFHKKWKNTFKPDRNNFNPLWKNIDNVKNWTAFKKFIDAEKRFRGVHQQSKVILSKDQIIVREDSEWFIVVPLTHASSCFHGKSSNWCTTKEFQDAFTDYFFDKDITMVYCFKQDDPKKKMWAIAVTDERPYSAFFDYPNHSIKQSRFETETGLKFDDIVKVLDEHNDYIKQQREANKHTDFFSKLNTARKTKERNSRLEELILWNPEHAESAFLYARDVLQDPWPEAEYMIKKYPYIAYKYARDVNYRHRWPDAEKNISQDPRVAVLYARDILKGPWPVGSEAEQTIATDAEQAFYYARDILQKPWPPGEDAISKNSEFAYYYARDVLNAPWPKAEPTIAKSGENAKKYAKYVLKDPNFEQWRWKFLKLDK